MSAKTVVNALIPIHEIKLERKVLLSEGEIVFFINNAFGTVSSFESACLKLEKYKFGKLNVLLKEILIH